MIRQDRLALKQQDFRRARGSQKENQSVAGHEERE
jgi:hypothetical protein